jgi:hypothetical protein
VAGHPLARRDADNKSLAAVPCATSRRRAAWRAAVAQRDAQPFVFVDERGTPTALTRLSSWAPHEQRARGSVPRTHGQNSTVVAARAPDGLPTPWLIAGAMETATCAWDITEQLAPRLRPGQVVVLDNLSAHPAERMRQALEARDGARRFLPPSSPDFTPIEQAFSKRKALLRGRGACTREAFEEAVHLAIAAITRADATAWFAHVGYALPAQQT